MTATMTREPVERVARRRSPPWLIVVVVAIAAAFALPLASLLRENLTGETGLLTSLADADAVEPLLRTLTLAVAVTFGCVVLGTALAWLVVRTDVPGRRALGLLAPLPLVIPSFVGALAAIAAFAPGGLISEALARVGIDHNVRVEGFGPAVVVLVLLGYPFVYLPVAARLTTLPVSLEESARSLGRTPRQVFRTVVLPQLTGSIAAGGLLVSLYALSEFGAVQLLRYDTLTRVIYSARLFQTEISLALSLLLAVIAITIVIAERAVARRRLHTEAVGRGRGAARGALGAWRWPAALFAWGVVALALVVPVSVLVHWVVQGARSGVELRADRLWEPAATTAWLGVGTAFVAVAVVLPIAYLTARYRSPVGSAANALVMAGFAVPGLVLALALVTLVLATPVLGSFYQTYPVLVFAYIVHFGSQAIQSSQVAVGSVPARLEDGARSLGARWPRRVATIDLPLMRPGLAAGAGLVLLATMKELPATLLLAPIGTQTLATRIWSTAEEGFYAQAGLASLVLIALSGALTWLLTARRRA